MNAIKRWNKGDKPLPCMVEYRNLPGFYYIESSKGKKYVSSGDFIIESAGEFYPCSQGELSNEIVLGIY